MNKVERERQYFESKKQNDLFDLMSVTATAKSQEPTIQPSDYSSSLKTTDILAKNSLDELESQVNYETILSSSGAATSCLNEFEVDNQIESHFKEKAPLDRSSHSPKSCLTSAITSLKDEISLNDKDTAINTSSHLKTHVSERLHDSPRLQKSDWQRSEKQVENGENLNASVKENKDHNDQNVNHIIARKPITTDQLVQFVSTRVPRNKRVFCLIVRDKMSRLNKTKSYFYPTYYLFIQAIVDIDETNDQIFSHNNEEEYAINGDIVSTNVSNSADNSFSASSSISADMLFIGATSANQQQVSNMKHAQGNSYSDNEACVDIETDDDYNTDGVKFHKRLNAEKSFGLKSTTSLHGRDSPLVFPNLDNISCSNPSNNDANCNVSGSFSSTAWLTPKDVVNDKNLSLAQGQSNSSRRLEMDATNNSKSGKQTLKSDIEFQLKKIEQQEAELSIEDSNEDGEDLDDDSDNDEFNLEPSMNESSAKGKISKVDGRRNERGIDCNSRHQSLFDNDRNPYTGTYGVLLAGRKRKKAKT